MSIDPKGRPPVSREMEEEYFRRREAELLEAKRREAAAKKELEEIGRAAGINDERVVAELSACGYNRETIPLLHLVPLIQVAWADGEISEEERRHIHEASRLHGIEDGSAAGRQLASWLESKPSEEFFRRSLKAIRAILQALEPESGKARANDLLSLCLKVASASGGFFGFGRKVSREEQELLEQIAAELDSHHHTAAVQVAEKMSGGTSE
ncbi:MAG: hypothetical protein ACM3S5_10640 [Rhodospirillales bacterium]